MIRPDTVSQWEYEKQIEHLNEMLLGHEIIVYNVPAGNKKMTEDDVVKSRGMIIQYVRKLIDNAVNEEYKRMDHKDNI